MSAPKEVARTTYATRQIEGISVFYREAGGPTLPTLMLFECELHLFDGAHFVLEDHTPEVASVVRQFYQGRVAVK
jgi:hypothetical protein